MLGAGQGLWRKLSVGVRISPDPPLVIAIAGGTAVGRRLIFFGMQHRGRRSEGQTRYLDFRPPIMVLICLSTAYALLSRVGEGRAP